MVGSVGGPGTSTVNNIMNYVDLPVGGNKQAGGQQAIPDANGGGQSGDPGGDMTPPGPNDIPESSAITLTLARIESSSGKASELLNKALVTQIQNEKSDALNQQLAARQASKDSLLAAAGQLKQEAQDILSSAIANLVVSVVVDAVSLGLTVAGGVTSGKGAAEENNSKAMDELKESGLSKWGGEIKNMSVLSSKGKMLGDIGEEVGRIGGTAGGFASAMGQWQSKNDEGQEKIFEAQAQQFDAQADAAKQRTQDMQDFADKVIDFINQIRQSKSDMMAAIVQKG